MSDILLVGNKCHILVVCVLNTCLLRKKVTDISFGRKYVSYAGEIKAIALKVQLKKKIFVSSFIR